jgi:WXXGXW repeat (2 copies)
MNITTRQFLKSAGLAAIALACGVNIASAQVIVVERGPMPALREEIITVAPSPRHHWVHGHWAWRHAHWEWIPGHYIVGEVPAMPVEIVEVETARPGPQYVWIKGHHVWEGSRWVWHRGVWVR